MASGIPCVLTAIPSFLSFDDDARLRAVRARRRMRSSSASGSSSCSATRPARAASRARTRGRGAMAGRAVADRLEQFFSSRYTALRLPRRRCHRKTGGGGDQPPGRRRSVCPRGMPLAPSCHPFVTSRHRSEQLADRFAGMRKTALRSDLLLASAVTAQPAAGRVAAGPEGAGRAQEHRYDGDLTLDSYRPRGLERRSAAGDLRERRRSPRPQGMGAVHVVAAARGDARHRRDHVSDDERRGRRGADGSAAEVRAGACRRLKIDPNRIALWACSANARARHGAHRETCEDFRAAAFFYGIMTTAPAHPDVPVFIARAGRRPDAQRLHRPLGRAGGGARPPVTLITYPEGLHGFELREDTPESRQIITQTLDFLQFHLTDRADAAHRADDAHPAAEALRRRRPARWRD